MTYTLTLTTAPHAQLQKSMTLKESEVVIGRDIDCHWVIDDPEMLVSGRHCVISKMDEDYVIIDCSTNGLFLDGSPHALGPGNTAALDHGTTLQLGDYVVTVAVERQTLFPAETALEPSAPPEPVAPPEASKNGLGLNQLFPDQPPLTTPEKTELAPASVSPPVSVSEDSGSHFIPEPDLPRPEVSEEALPLPESAPVLTGDSAAVRDAFFRGLGLDPATHPTQDTEAEMEALGQRFRELVDGLVFMLRSRDQQKSQIPVQKTQIGATRNNALKVLPGTDRAVASLVRHEGEGFLQPEESIKEAFRDLAMHNINTWNGLEAALHKLISDINPDRFEKGIENAGRLEVFASGGRGAMLWKLYKGKYKDLSEVAEQTFLGTVGHAFARAYGHEVDKENAS